MVAEAGEGRFAGLYCFRLRLARILLLFLCIHVIEDIVMLSWALTFLIIAIIAGIFGFSGIAGTATSIAWILFVVGLVLAIIFALTGRRGRGL